MANIPKPLPPYKLVVIETYQAPKGNHQSDLRARPAPGQPFPQTMDVSCSNTMRKAYPLGTKFLVHAKLTQREGGKLFLYSPPNGPFEVVA